ncbi:hypothetical protein CFIO01_09809 [Colletotrichum fioriniae PJ7]|uniref:Uncharacterized protein n=1 Tax=Colletotrichum fioriniae PJ7 TaxID=1445577 RepID=A0A010QZP4_9PEZI|nr:hypothetical protein CFIO01_09809 [Colletotrichum fioriniae PJ7]
MNTTAYLAPMMLQKGDGDNETFPNDATNGR